MIHKYKITQLLNEEIDPLKDTGLPPGINIDDLIKKGQVIIDDPENSDPVHNKFASKIIKINDFGKLVKELYVIYREMNKYKLSYDDRLAFLASEVQQDITLTVRDVKLLAERVKLIKSGLD